MIVELTPTEIQLCTDLANLRKETNRKVQPNDRVERFGLDADYVEREGVLSELAFCKLVNSYPNEVFSIGHRSASKGEDDGDATVNGLCIDVKATKHQKGQLVSFRKNPAIDLIVLMIGENGYYRLAGGIWSQDMYQSSRWGVPEKMRQPCYSARQEELLLPKQLFDLFSNEVRQLR